MAQQFDEQAIIQISCETANANIYYTLDGTDPSASNGNLYSDEFTTFKNVTVKAVGVKDGLLTSDIDTEIITVKLPNQESYYNKTVYDDSVKIYFTKNLSDLYGNTCKCRYTTDGADPTAETASIIAEGEEITLTNNCIFKAIITAENNINSDIVSINISTLRVLTPDIIAFNEEVVADPTFIVEY